MPGDTAQGDLHSGPAREARTFCRICTGHCGLVLSIDAGGIPVSARGDRGDPHSIGYICSKGVTSVQAHTDASRLLQPQKRQPDGSFTALPLDDALGEITARLTAIVDRHGPDALAAYRGTGGFFTTSGLGILPGFLAAFGSAKLYTTLTIDQSAKVVSVYRLGYWPPGRQTIQTADVAMLIGGNPLVSMAQLDSRHPVKRMNAAKERGLKLIVIDPRRTETARLADLFIQPIPGHDAAIAAALIRIVLAEAWHDAPFCADHVNGLAALRQAVLPFTPERVAARARIEPAQLRQAAEMFARVGRRGTTTTGTGVDMGPHSNLAEHLFETLNIVCGRMVRAGELVQNPGLVVNPGPKPAQVVNLPRPWEQGPRSRIGGYGLIGGEMVTGRLADDMLVPGDGRVRALFNHGGNPAVAVPDQARMAQALGGLDLLVSIEPVMSQTARLSHYVLPPKLQFERPDLPIYLFESGIFPSPYTRYTDAVVAPPAGSDVCDEWRVFWDIARRAGRPISFMGTPLDMRTPPTEDALIALTLAAAPVTLDEVKRHPMGYFHDEVQHALPADPATAGRFTLMPDDVAAELAALTAELDDNAGNGHAFRMIGRRARHRMNSIGATLPDLIRLLPRNQAHMNPDDLCTLGIAPGDWIELRSDQGAIEIEAAADETVRTGVVSVSHGFGGIPGDTNPRRDGASPNMLISTEHAVQTINAMPRMTAVPVDVRRLSPASAAPPAPAAAAPDCRESRSAGTGGPTS